jgi:hypothetical protein
MGFSRVSCAGALATGPKLYRLGYGRAPFCNRQEADVAAPNIALESVAGSYSVVRLAAGAPVTPPDRGALYALVRTREETSLVCDRAAVPGDAERVEHGWRAFRVAGTLDFALTGILARIAQPLAAAGVSLFAVSTFDADYVLVREGDWDAAVRALGDARMALR